MSDKIFTMYCILLKDQQAPIKNQSNLDKSMTKNTKADKANQNLGE